MLHVYEFEVFEDDGMLLAVPYDMDGGTQGRDMREVAEMEEVHQRLPRDFDALMA